MKIKELISKEIFAVYGIYWVDNKTYFYGFPKNTFGISSFVEDEVEIVDPIIGADFEYVRSGEKMSGLFHKDLLGNNMLDRLLDHDHNACKEFSSLLGMDP